MQTTMVLPNFLICGAMKAGTTALYDCLKRHPNVFMSWPKETFFFGNRYSHVLEQYNRYERGIEWFASHFEACDGEGAVGEASTDTMCSPEAPARVAKHLPDAKLLFVLRDPIDRAYSHYHFLIQTGNVNAEQSFSQVIRDVQNPLRQELIEYGLYARQLDRFDDHFAPRQMKFILNRDLRQQMTEVVRDVYGFLGVDPQFNPEVTRENVTKYPRSRKAYHWLRQSWLAIQNMIEPRFPKISRLVRDEVLDVLLTQERPSMREDDRAYLRDIYEVPNSKLEERIDRDLSHWT